MRYTTNRELIKKSRDLRKNMTLAERIFWSELRSKKLLGYKFRRQVPIYNFIVDFYCYELNLIIEIDGPIHKDERVMSDDRKRDEILQLNGYRILRIPNLEIITDLKGSVTKMKDYIISIPSPS